MTYLRGTLFQHFSPVSRLADYVLAHWFHSSIAAAHIIELVLLAASVLAFSWAIAELVGHHWWRHLLTLAFAESLVLVHLLGWWTATANILPATIFGLLTIAAFLRYRRLGNRRWIVVSLLSYALSLCSHESSWLVVGYLILFDVLVLAPGGRFREALVRLWREAWIWLGYGLLTVARHDQLLLLLLRSAEAKADDFGELVRYIGIQFSQAFAPSAIGLRPLTTGWTNTAALVFDSFVFAVIVIVSIYRRPSAWRVWTVFGIGFLANSIMIGANRVGYFGVDFGQRALLPPVTRIPLPPVRRSRFFARPVRTCPTPCARTPPSGLDSRNTSDQQASVSASCFVSGLLLGVGLYAVAFVTSATTMTAQGWVEPGKRHGEDVFHDLGWADATPRAVAAGKWPFSMRPCPTAPWLQHLILQSPLYDLPVVSAGAHVDQLREVTFKVASDGALIPVQFRRASGTSRGLPVSAVVGSSGATPITATSRGPAHLCCDGWLVLSSARPGGRIDVRLVSPVNAQPVGCSSD